MAASAHAFFAVKRPRQLFHALDLDPVGAAEGNELVVEILASKRVYGRLKLRRGGRKANEQHLKQSVVGDDLLPEEIERTGKLA